MFAVNLVYVFFRWDRWDKGDSRINTGFVVSHLVFFGVGQVGRFHPFSLPLDHMGGCNTLTNGGTCCNGGPIL